MSLDSDWDSRSIDSRRSDFNDGAEAILMNADFKIEAPRGEEDNRSRCSTPESHRNSCHGYHGYGQGALVYSCGCYKYKEMARYKYPEPEPEPEPSNLEQASEVGGGDDDSKGIGASSLKWKILHEDDIVHSISRDITAMSEALLPDTKLPPSKRRKLGRQFELFEEVPTQDLIKLAKEVVILGEALVRMKEVLHGQSTTLLTICEVLFSITEQEGSSG
ncbi:hypothetical protein EDD22DRAFT_849043 [Suillus occidentalis]|nr:hypothetical protein EDD22DRAFT_849043 [Suillus occidentalis]